MAESRHIALWKGWIPLALYHGIFLLVVVACSPVLLWRIAFDRHYRAAMLSRLGRVPATTSDRRVIWIHGVSVGEIKALATLIESMSAHDPDLEMVVSATTPTGFGLANRLYPGRRVIHFPIDFGLCPGRALDRVRPVCVLLMELEIWPNFLQAAARRRIPVAVINGRISERSFRGYRLVRWFLPQFDWVDRFCVQNETYRARLLAIGVADRRISVTGNMKYDGVLLEDVPAGAASLRDWLSPDGREVVVGGSTHGREDEWLARVVQRLARARERAIRLVLVPRHPERVPAVIDALGELDLRAVRWSERGGLDRPLLDADAVVVDTIGHLEAFYGACDVAFVGGSLVPHGGQNMLEAAAIGRAVVFGPHTANFRNDVELLLDAGAAIQIGTVAELEPVLARLLDDPQLRRDLGARAVELIRANQGATERTRELLVPLLVG